MVLVALGTLLIATGGFEAYRLPFAFDSKEGLRIFKGRSPPRMSRPINYFFQSDRLLLLIFGRERTSVLTTRTPRNYRETSHV
jgi:hypothetical protein